MPLHRCYLRLIPLDLPLTLFLLSALLGLWPAYDRSRCWNTLAALSAGVVLYLLISRLATSPRRWRAVAMGVVVIGVLVSLYFVTQYGHFGYPDKYSLINRLGAWVGRIVPPSVILVPPPNSVAAFLEGMLFLAIALVGTEEQLPWRLGGAVGVGLIALALLMSASRGAWLAVLVTGGLWVALHWRPARRVVVAGAGLALGLAICVAARHDITVLGDIPVVDHTLAPLFIRPDRLDVYRNSVYLIQDFPLTGIGLGEQFAMVLSKYALLIRVPYLTYSHNLYLEVWLQQGLLGAVAWLWLTVALYQAAWACAKPGPDLRYQSTWLGVTAIFIHGLTDARQYVDLWCWFPFFALLGLNAAVVLRRASVGLPSKLPGWRRWVLPAGAVGAFLVAVAVSLPPMLATVHANVGCVLQAHGDLPPSLSDGQRVALRQEAADYYHRATQIDPYNRTAHQRLGIMLMDEGRFDESVKHLELAWAADLGNTTTHKALGLAYVWVGDLEQAKPLLRNVPDIVEELSVWAWWRDSQGQTEQSANASRMAELLAPGQP